MGETSSGQTSGGCQQCLQIRAGVMCTCTIKYEFEFFFGFDRDLS